MMKILQLLVIYFFCHIMVTNKLHALEDLIEIPPDIYKRMLNKSNYLMYSWTADALSDTSLISVGVAKESDEKYYIYVKDALDDIGRCLIGYYILKDI